MDKPLTSEGSIAHAKARGLDSLMLASAVSVKCIMKKGILIAVAIGLSISLLDVIANFNIIYKLCYMAFVWVIAASVLYNFVPKNPEYALISVVCAFPVYYLFKGSNGAWVATSILAMGWALLLVQITYTFSRLFGSENEK